MTTHAPVDYELASQGEPMPPPVPPPDVRPDVQSVTVSVRRVVNPARYESAEVVLSMTAVPDPHAKVSDTLDRMWALLETRLAVYLANLVPPDGGSESHDAASPH